MDKKIKVERVSNLPQVTAIVNDGTGSQNPMTSFLRGTKCPFPSEKLPLEILRQSYLINHLMWRREQS